MESKVPVLFCIDAKLDVPTLFSGVCCGGSENRAGAVLPGHISVVLLQDCLTTAWITGKVGQSIRKAFCYK